jgi:hypothetical protein
VAEAAEKGIEIYREAVEPTLDEPVIAACLFSRQGMMSNKLAGHFGALPYAIARKRQQMRAGGLRQHFILAVTPRRVHAFEQKVGGRNPIGELADEVARWQRSALRVSSKLDRMTGGMTLSVRIESPTEGEAVNCSVGRSPESEEFLALLADPVAVR